MAQFTIAQSFVLAALSMAMFVQGQLIPANCARNYTVQPGDVCDAISAAHNASTFQIASANNGTINANCTNLFPGEIICLGLVGRDCQTIHVVASGDSCPAIASAAGINVTTLLADNPNINSACTNIYPGEVLCVAHA